MARFSIQIASHLLLLVRSTRGERNASATPLSITPSGYWNGDDGWWSTFWMEVGTQPQTLKVLPATSASAGDTSWVVIPQGCSIGNPTLADCDALRGNVFTSIDSSSWTITRPGTTQQLANDGLFNLITIEQHDLNLTGNAYYGFDSIQLGLPGSGLPCIHHQLVAGIVTNDFWLGTLGLSPLPFNFTTFDDPIPSLLSTLQDEGYIPSISWGYTAGAHYQELPVYGSLTLGGYDSNRFDPATALQDIPFGADISRDLLVSLDGIKYKSNDGDGALASESIYVFIDSLVSQLWLPVEVCKQFEQTFGLEWNATAETYFISEETHSALLAQNPTFVFTLGSRGKIVDISLPYAAFDLNMTEPLVQGSLRCFPLKQAQDESQYTLGRAFLQEAYVTADYARHNFTIAQARHPLTSVNQNLVAIIPPGSDLGSSDGGLGAGSIAGIVIGAVVFASLIAMAIVYMRRRRKRQQDSHDRLEQVADTMWAEKVIEEESPELDGAEWYGLARPQRLSELQAGHLAQELEAHERPHELDGTPRK